MKQLLIVSTAAYATDITALGKGQIGATKLSDGSLITGAKATENFALYLGQQDKNGNTLAPFVIPEVDVNTLVATKSAYAAGNAFQCKFTCLAITANTTRNQTLTVVITKKGKVFNERSNWSIQIGVKKGDTMTAAAVATKIVDMVNANTEIGITASAASAVVTFDGPDNNSDYSVIFTDDLAIAALTPTTSTVASGNYKAAVPTVGDADYVKALAQDCIAGKGVKYLYGEGKEIYPDYPEEVSGNYTIYTLKFAVGRDASKTRDERVKQIVHIAVPTGAAAGTQIEYITGITAVSA